jgi:chemotaxis protein histidine kinase CheA/ActR/RegA family two-component response regulator
MTLDDLLTLLASEYAEGLDEAKHSLALRLESAHDDGGHVAAQEESARAHEFIARSIGAARLVSLEGAALFLEHVAEVLASSDAQAPTDAMAIVWISDALDVAHRYVLAPATEETVQATVEHAHHSPIALTTSWLDALATALATPPTLVADEDDQAQARFDPVGLNDTRLTTDDADPELLASMLHDAPTQLEKLYRLLNTYKEAGVRGETRAEGSLAEAQRIAHTLKGSGNIIGLPGIGRLAHRLEDTLVWLDTANERSGETEQCATRDAMLATETLQQMVAHLAGEDAAPAHALPILERMQSWAQRIYEGEADDYAPPPVVLGEQPTASADATVATIDALPARAAASADTTTLRVSSERIGRLVKRAGQSLASSQRFSQGLRDIDQRLQTTQERQTALRARLEELQRTVDRQVVALQARRDEQSEFDPLELDRYDALHLLSRVVAEAVQDQVDLTEEVRGETRRLLASTREEHRELREQHRELLDARLVPFGSLVPRLRRNVAQTSAALNKSARLEVSGEDTAIDADVLAKLTEPLLHLLRNAVDHGLESPEERVANGKSAEAVVSVHCVREGQQVRIELMDDGRGLDDEAIVEKARALGLVAQHAELGANDVHALILQRGFSTKDNVSDVSGRGLGLDIVNDRVKSMKGSLSIASLPNMGTSFTMRVPVSSGIAQSLIVACGGEQIAISNDQIVTVLPPGSVEANASHLQFGSESISIAPLAAWLGFATEAVLDTSQSTLVVAHGAEGRIALAVDRVREVRELVLQDVGALLRRIGGVQTGALSDNGVPLFAIDVAELQVRARAGVAPVSAALALRRRAATQRVRVLVVDDALSARRAVQTAFEDRGYEVHTASDGFEALEVLRKHAISLVATDLEMPNLNGLELTKRVRDVPAWASIPVVMITSRGGERHRQAALDVGVDEYLVKPFSDRQLIDVAQSFLHARQAAA